MSHATQGKVNASAVRPMASGRVFNFSAGPATMPLEVLEQLQADLVDLRGGGAGILERTTVQGNVLAAGPQDTGGVRG